MPQPRRGAAKNKYFLNKGTLATLYSFYLIIKFYRTFRIKNEIRMLGGFPGGAVVKNPPANAGDTGSSPGPARSHMPRSS